MRVVPGVVCRPVLLCAECGAAMLDIVAREGPVEAAVSGPPENAASRTGRPRSKDVTARG